MVINLIEWLNELFSQFGDALQTVLPLSPFRSLIDSIDLSDGLSWLNWFIPVNEMIGVFSLWLVAYGTYLLYRIILRWIKAVA